MAKNDNLKDFLVDVADAIREKKGTTDKINPQDFSSEIASIQSGGDIWGFDTIGYTPQNSPIAEWVAYSAEQKRRFESGEITKFSNDINLVIAPMVDISSQSNLTRLYAYSKRLITIPLLDFTNAQNCSYMFEECGSFLCFPNIDMSNVTDISGMFYKCGMLLYLPSLDTRNVIAMNLPFNYCSKLKKIELLDLSSVTTFKVGSSLTALRYALIKNIGKSSLTTYDFSGATNWGVANDDIPDARQSLIDSLITYSYDRASNGMSTATIQLSSTTKALLTEEEIAQITNKGFTIS